MASDGRHAFPVGDRAWNRWMQKRNCYMVHFRDGGFYRREFPLWDVRLSA